MNDTEDALGGCGVSRLSHQARMALEPLEKAEAEEAVDRMFRRYRVGGGADELRRWAAAVAEDSSGFPQHLHVGMMTAAEVLAKEGGVARADGLAPARAKARTARRKYYRDRISSDLDERGRALAGLVEDVAKRKALGTEALYALARRRLAEDAEAPTTAEAKRFVSQLIHKGVLQRKSDRTGYEVPIPSMATWILGEYARSLDLGEAETDGSSL